MGSTIQVKLIPIKDEYHKSLLFVRLGVMFMATAPHVLNAGHLSFYILPSSLTICI